MCVCFLSISGGYMPKKQKSFLGRNNLPQVEKEQRYGPWPCKISKEGLGTQLFHRSHWSNGASLVSQMVKNLPAMQETQVRSLGQKDPLKKIGCLLQYSCLENSMDRGAWWAIQSMGSQRVGHDWVTNTSTFQILITKLSCMLLIMLDVIVFVGSN